MNWAQQTEEMFSTWQETQQTIWQNWLGLFQITEKPAQSQELWHKMLDAWQKSVEQTLTAQNESFTLWLEEAANLEGLPESMKSFIAQGQQMAQQWQTTQTEMWQNWFELFGKSGIKVMDLPGQPEAQKAFENWQATMQQMVETQMNLMKSWIPQS